MAELKDKSAVAQGSPSAKESAGEKAQLSPAQVSEEWVFTLNSQTGEAIKIEKVDAATGQRTELSDEEYVAVLGSPEDYAAAAAYGYDPSAELYSQAGIEPYSYEAGYYQGMADYEVALGGAAASGYSPEEEAYYQGIADYAALFG